MKAGWKIAKLGNLASYVNGYPFKPTDWEEEGLPIIRIQNLNSARDEYHYFRGTILPRYKVCKGDILISWSASLGVFTWRGPDALLNQHIFKVVFDKEEINKEFFVYAVSYKLDEMKKLVHGATMQHITRGKFDGIDIPIPPLTEQQRIVDILDWEFAKIDALKANAEKSLQAAKDLFQATLKKELEPKEGWETKHLNEWATYSIGLTYKPADVSNEGTIVLRSSNIQNDELVFDDIVRVACKVKDELFVEDGDILMCSRNGSARLVGKVARIGKEQERMTYGTFMTIIRSKYNPILFYYFKSNGFRSQISKGENTMINQITKYMLNDVVISLPNDPREVSRIARSLDDLNDRCKSLQENYQKTLILCDDLKQSLLRKAFNGEL